jgi:L-threonylcarbamoyladenylate synthase
VILFSDDAFEEAARSLFADLRKMDDEGVDRIFAGALKQSDERGFAVMNRMLKSAGYNVIDV